MISENIRRTDILNFLVVTLKKIKEMKIIPIAYFIFLI